MNHTPQDIKSCCAAAYGSAAVTLLLGEAYHPGGSTLTRHLADRLDLRAGERVLDVAAGRGATALLLAGEYGVRVDGVDLSDANAARARKAADALGLTPLAAFVAGDAERLPYANGTFDAVVCECALCTFPDKPAAVAELARVLRPGGRLGITDVTTDPTRLPSELTTLAAWVACVADARPHDEYTAILTAVGLTVTRTEQHDDALARMLDQIEARLAVLRMTARDQTDRLGIDIDRARPVLSAARTAIRHGNLGYALTIAVRPREVSRPRAAGQQ